LFPDWKFISAGLQINGEYITPRTSVNFTLPDGSIFFAGIGYSRTEKYRVKLVKRILFIS